MGNNSKSVENIGVCHLEPAAGWTSAQNLGYCQLLYNTQTGQSLEEYTIPLDGRLQPLQEFQRYEFRRTQNLNLVTVHHVQKQESEYLCSGMDYIKVKTERIPYRLSELNKVSVQESLYILQESLIGFKTIFERQGPIHITADMIGLNTAGKVKVWLNENFAKNYPDEPLTVEANQQKPTETMMVQGLFQLVGEKCMDGQLPG